jgi:E3 ubiquitin-protein ligase MUL1
MVAALQEQEARMEQEKQDRFWLGLAMAAVLSVLAVVQSYRMKMAEREACAKNQQRLKSLLVQRMSQKETVPAAEEDPAVLERLQCVVCLTAEREVILLDCGHVCACRPCADTLLREDHLCPVCRADIRTVKPAFIS